MASRKTKHTHLKRLKNIMSAAIWTVVGLYIVFILLIHIPPVQGAMADAVAAAVGGKLGTKVEIGRVDLGMLNRIIIDDVLIYDQRAKQMVRIARATAKIDVTALAQGRISISSAQLFGARLQLYKLSATADANYQFALDSLASKDTTKHSTLDLHIGSFIMRHSSLDYDRLDIAPTNGHFSTSHLHLSDISANVQLRVLCNDSVDVNVRRLSAQERSGLCLNRLSFKMEGGLKGLRLSEFTLNTQNSTIEIPSLTATYESKEGRPDWHTARWKGEIKSPQLVLADFASLVPPLRSLVKPLTLSSNLRGTAMAMQIDGLRITSGDDDVSLNASGWLRRQKDAPLLWHAAVRRLHMNHSAVKQVYESIENKGRPLPAIVERIGDISLNGIATATDDKSLTATCTLQTDAGKVDADVVLWRSGNFEGSISTDNMDMAQLCSDGKFGKVVADIDVDGHRGDRTTVNAKGSVSQFSYNGHKFSDIGVDGTYDNGDFSGKLNINDHNINADIEGELRHLASGSAIKIKADIARLVPSAIGLTSKWGDAVFSVNIDAAVKGSKVADANGLITVKNMTVSKSGDDDYTLNNLTLWAGNRDGQHYMTMNSDFGHAEVAGRFDPKTVVASITNFVGKKLPTLPGLPPQKKSTNNAFLISATINNTVWLERLFNVPLSISEPVNIHGKVDDLAGELYFNCSAPAFNYNEKPYRNATVAVTSPEDKLHYDAHLTKMFDNGDELTLSLTGQAADNKLSTALAWQSNGGKATDGLLNAETQMTVNNGHREAHIDILPSTVAIGDTQWKVSPSSIVAADNRIVVDNFSIHHGDQHILIDGTASKSRMDSLIVDLNGVNLGYVLNLVNFHTVDFDGFVSGRAFVKAPFGDIDAKGRVKVRSFSFEGGGLGTYDTDVVWNGKEGKIEIDGSAADGPGHRLSINGYISPVHSRIDLAMKANNTRLDFMRSFMSSFSNDIDGVGTGELRLAGPFSNINLTGLVVVDGEATIDPLGCRYRLSGDTVRFVPDDIQMDNAPVYDKEGHRGWLTGGIHHRHLTNMSYDLNVRAENLLVYDYKDFGDDTFYGTVYGTGDVGVHGRSGELIMDINITPGKNTVFVYNVASDNSVSNTEFIHWNDATPHNAFNMPQTKEAEKPRIPERMPGTDMHLNFALNVTPDATMRLLMDSRTNDYITLNGSGAIRATYYNRGSFDMYGTYVVDHGTYGITIQDIIKKNFTFNQGGTIVFGGNPFDAALNLQAVYTVNGVSLSDLNIGNSFSSNTIKVNCLMNIGGQPRQPQIEFDLDMPTVSTDEKQLVRSVLNSEDEMNQQVLYLLGIGRFYPQSNNNATAQDERQQSQTSLAMQSLLSGTISSQINTLLGTVIKSNNWNFGANISTGDEGWNNAEYEGLLSGRLLNNRLLFNGQFGYRDNANTATTSFIGDFDIRYLLLPNGNIALKVYNQTNDRYFTKSSLNTQGIGIILKKDFNGLHDLFGGNKKRK